LVEGMELTEHDCKSSTNPYLTGHEPYIGLIEGISIIAKNYHYGNRASLRRHATPIAKGEAAKPS
jgi:hypothetical protein